MLFTKRIGIVIILAALMFVGCGESPIDRYNRAIDNTSGIRQNDYTTYFDIDTVIDTESLEMKERRVWSLLKTIAITLEGSNHGSQAINTQSIHMSLCGIGLNFKYYDEENHLNIKMPFVKEYVKLDEFAGIRRELMQLWNSQLVVQAIDKKETGVIIIAEKEEKVTRYVVTISDESFRSFIDKSIELILGKLDLLKVDLEAYQSTIDTLGSVIVQNVEYELYISSSDYIIQESFLVEIKVAEDSNHFIESSRVKIQTSLYNINVEKDIDRPIITEENSISLTEFYKKTLQLLKQYDEY